jgi:hypothetical protein
MRSLVAALLLGLVGGAALADEAQWWVPTALAARVGTGQTAGLFVGVEAVDGGALVTVSHPGEAFAVAPPFPLPVEAAEAHAADLDVPIRFVPPREITLAAAGARDALEVLRLVIAYVSRTVRLEEDDPGHQDAAAVLARRVSRCSGRANLAVGLLRVLGIPARAVSGLLLGDKAPRRHRWGEAWLGELGWVGFDPGASVGMVSVNYLPLRGAGEGRIEPGIRAVHLDGQSFESLPLRNGLKVVPVGGATLECVAPSSDTDLTAVLLGADGSRWLRRGRGEVRFTLLLPGTYRLKWWGADRSGRQRLDVGDGGVVQVRLAGEGGS